MAPSDFHSFGFMKAFFLEDIHKLLDRWTKCVAKQGDYVE